jgi:RNA polymerase sigma-70 factor (ECF subfamily)
MAKKRRIDFSKLSQEAICKKISRGNESAFSFIYDKHSKELNSFILGKCKNGFLAEEICQIAWIKVWRNIKNFRNNSAIKTWIHRIAINALWDYYRKEKKYVDVESLCGRPEQDADSEKEKFLAKRACVEYKTVTLPLVFQKLDYTDISPKIQKALGNLPVAGRKIFEMAVFQGLEYTEIAKKTKIPVGTVMSRIFYARKRLKEELGDIDKILD